MPGQDEAPPDDPAEALLNALLGLFRLTRRFDDSTIFNLSWSHYAVLHRLLRSQRDIRLTEIADDMGGDISVLSRQVTSLTDQGLVARVRDPHDGRAWLLRLTPAGRDRLQQVADHRLAVFRQHLAGFDEADLALCARLIESLNRAIVKTARPKGGANSPTATPAPPPPDTPPAGNQPATGQPPPD